MRRNLELAQFTPPLGHLHPFTGAARGCAGEGAGATGGLARSASSATELARSSSASTVAARGYASVEGPMPVDRNLCAGPMGADT